MPRVLILTAYEIEFRFVNIWDVGRVIPKV